MSISQRPHESPLIGIGVYVGGLKSFQKFLGAIPERSGLAYILIQHPLPSQKSRSYSLLCKSTSLPVIAITDICSIEADHIYIALKDYMPEIIGGSLKLKPREGSNPQMPIDIFFSSLSRVYGHWACGVVLSGIAGDGTVGLREIKEHGGSTFSEEPGPREPDGSRNNKIGSVAVDFVLPPEEMPDKLSKIFTVNGEKNTGEYWGPPSPRKFKDLLPRNVAFEKKLDHFRGKGQRGRLRAEIW